MKITFKDFLSLKNVDFEIKNGISIIAGKNGSGKSQLLIGLTYKLLKSTAMSDHFLNDLGYDFTSFESNKITICPTPNRFLYKKAVRPLATENRDASYAYPKPLSTFRDVLTYGFQSWDRKYSEFFSYIANICSYSNFGKSELDENNDWAIIKNKFKAVFNKDLICNSTQEGLQIGIQLDNNKISNFSTLSTGELEFLSLICDLIIVKNEKDDPEKKIESYLVLIDEIDSHFHPDLQQKIIDEISDLCKDIYVIITTHSPSVMLSVPADKLFYLEPNQDCIKSAKENLFRNQITQISEDSALFLKISELYKGFSTDLRLANHFSQSLNNDLLRYAEQCMTDSYALDYDDAKKNDPQISSLKTFLLTTDVKVIAEVGCGIGRTLAMFNSLDEERLKQITYIGLDINDDNLHLVDKLADEIGLKNKLFHFTTAITYENETLDACIFANVLHEIPQTEICTELNKYFKYLKPNGKVYILEALELLVGEKKYIVFYPNALKKLFHSDIDNRNIIIHMATPSTYSGTPLLEAFLTIVDPQKININKKDLLDALNSIVEEDITALNKHYSGEAPLTSRAFAFKSHNLTHAVLALHQIKNT